MSNANYMDGVPVKIVEKFNPPFLVYNLPQSLLNKISLENDFYRKCPSFTYDFQLERKALSKIEQWKLIRKRNKEQRTDRILKREHLRRQQIEDRQKVMLNNVSYPSTDDLSSSEEEGNSELCTKIQENGMTVSDMQSASPQNILKQSANSFHNILQPTVLSFNSSSTAYNSNTSTTKTTFENKSLNSFNYKDFEEDTSSPFDNIELKTINDLDVLAQVLHNSQIKSPTGEMLNDCVLNDIPKKDSICLPEQGKSTVENIPKCNLNLPRFNNDLNSGSEISNQSYNNQSNKCNEILVESNNYQLNKNHQNLLDDPIKSKSVPDIIKELRDEIKQSEIRRHRNCSFNDKEESSCKPTDKNNDVANEDVFSRLDNNAKELVRRISAMGFPLKRVARIVQVFGADDKKVVEHLIPLSELADLGFEESKISDALLRNENNKNKALDDLIS